MKEHRQIHMPNRPRYRCDVCFSTFGRQYDLNTHLIKFQKKCRPRFLCDACPSTFGRRSDLNTHHQRLHTSGAAEDAGPLLIKFKNKEKEMASKERPHS